MGALNLITPAKRKQAAGLVKDGITVSMARELITEKAIDVPCPVEWAMTQGDARRWRWTASPTRASTAPNTTHLDSFAHVFFNGKMWNGYPVKELVTRRGRRGQELGADDEERHRHARRCSTTCRV